LIGFLHETRSAHNSGLTATELREKLLREKIKLLRKSSTDAKAGEVDHVS